MKNNGFKFLIGLLLPAFLLGGCSKDSDTSYFEDPNSPGIGIFSNSGNNLLSCFIDGKAWRTNDRHSVIFSNPTLYEVSLIRVNATNTSLPDTLQIVWQGHYTNDSISTGQITLHLALSSNFSYSSFAAFEGQRIKIDSATNGFFTTTEHGSNNNLVKGNGNIYFHSANTDSIVQGISGKMSGLFDADFNSYKITSGRFDHELTTSQVQF